MTTNNNTAVTLATNFVKAILPLGAIVSDPDLFRSFLYRLGWRVDSLPPEYAGLASNISDLENKLESVIDEEDPVKIGALISAIINFVQAVQSIDIVPVGIGSLDREEFLENFKSIFLDLFLADYLRAKLPELYNLSRLLGIIELSIQSGSDTRAAFQKVKLNLDRIPAIIEDPLKIPKFIYGWNTNDFNFKLLIQHLDELFSAIGITTYIELDNGETLRSLAPSLTYYSSHKLVLPVLLGYIDDRPIELGLELIKWPSQNGALPGIALVLTFPSDFVKTFQLSEDLALKFTAESNGDLSVGFVVQSNSLDVIRPLESTPIPFQSDLGISFEYKPADPAPLIGSVDGSRLDLQGGTIGFDITPSAKGIELRLRLDLRELSCKLNVEEGDSFINQLSGGKPIEGNLSLDLQWSSVHGINFAATGLLEWIIPSHLDLGFAKLDSFNLRIKPDGNSLPVFIQTNVTTSLGPLDLRIQNIGLKAHFAFPDNYTGNLGPLDVDIGFKPPSGLGLSIDGAGFKGGGFLDFEPEQERYSGMLELGYRDQFTLKAFGLLTTRLPNGQSGFSLLIVISSEFTPIQLGFGFKLNGVGGLLGLNRTVKTEPLRAGLRDNTLGSILFPTDIIANADRILSDLRQVFPPQDGRFVFGPMAKITWGTPVLLTADLGLVIEVPDPMRLVILGLVRGILPDEKAAILRLQVNFLGEINFERQQLSFDASLFDSKLLAFTLTGDMALRLYWGADANFLLTVGGFHPAYQPPPMNLPSIRRLTLALLAGDNPRLRLETYFAVTSNTVQLGARLELYAAASKFNAYGFLSFDVLLQFNPFYFVADITAMLALRVGTASIAGIKMSLTLEGPTPWKARGTAKLRLFWFLTISVRFSKTFGEARNTSLPDLAVLPLLLAALSADDNWEGEFPARKHRLESFKDAAGSGQLIVHPLGTLKISQKIVPLNLRIDRLGSQRPGDGREFQIQEAQLAGTPVPDPAPAQESFAPAQFFDMTDEEKLASPSFKNFDGGIRIGEPERLHTAYAAAREVKYELKYIDSQRDRRLAGPKELFEIDPVAFNSWTRQGAVAKSELSFGRRGKSNLAPDEVAVVQEPFAIVNTGDLKLFDDKSLLTSERAALTRVKALLETNPALRGNLQVVPAFEMSS